ncbi:acetyl-CoA carboxylase biotin carboxyl carrier protein subunit [Reyranella sp.]|uniref:acetyl-CoA carboxylase biotin carboxyl carrier protein subunit n=1 Tax=Reyranella sp. TaxID=1929291 RepID=UPI003D09B245
MRSIFAIDETEYRVFAVRERDGYRVHIDDRSYLIADGYAIADKGGEAFAYGQNLRPERSRPQGGAVEGPFLSVLQQEGSLHYAARRAAPVGMTEILSMCECPEEGGALVAVDGDSIYVWMDGETVTLRYHDPVRYLGGSGGASASDVILAPMPGTVIAVHAAAGAAVARGDTLMVIESMKLETAIKAPRDGTLAAVHVAVGQAFDRSAPLATLAAAEA